MAISHALAPLRRFAESSPDTLGKQVAELAHEVAKIAGTLRKQGGSTFEDVGHSAGEFANELAHQFAPVARQFRRQAKVAGKMVRDDPVPAIIAVGTVALLASLLMSRR